MFPEMKKREKRCQGYMSTYTPQLPSPPTLKGREIKIYFLNFLLPIYIEYLVGILLATNSILNRIWRRRNHMKEQTLVSTSSLRTPNSNNQNERNSRLKMKMFALNFIFRLAEHFSQPILFFITTLLLVHSHLAHRLSMFFRYQWHYV